MDSSMAGMSGMSMQTGNATTSDTMQQVTMTFFISTTTPLFTTAWTPTSTGQYAGTCIFLIVFAAISRALLSVRFNFERILAFIEQRNGGNQELLHGINTKTHRVWKANEAVLLGLLDVILATCSYLLMIAVMTMNVGYFLSVLAGIFVGSVAFGRFATSPTAH